MLGTKSQQYVLQHYTKLYCGTQTARSYNAPSIQYVSKSYTCIYHLVGF